MDNDTVDLTGLSDDGDEDEDLRLAIALSLQEQKKDRKTKDDGMKEERDKQPEKGTVAANISNLDSSGTSQAKPQTQNTFGALGLDRKTMEEERLKRLAAKRPRSDSSNDTDRAADVLPPEKRSATSSSSKPNAPVLVKGPSTSSGRPLIGQQRSCGTAISTSASQSLGKPLQFLNGTVKRTWAAGYPRTGSDIKIEEILQKDQLELAMLSSFVWSEEWILSKVDIRRTKLLLVTFADSDRQKEEMRENAPPNVRFCFPPMNGPGAMHSKLQILKFSASIRIVVPSGNLVSHDWGEHGGVMENMVFLIDLPRLSDPANHTPTAFSTELCRFLTVANVDKAIVSSLANYDFSRTARLRFVYTIPGGHTDELQRRTGYCGLGDAVAGLGLATTGAVDVDMVSASLGSLTCDFIGAMYNACQGDNGMKELNSRTRKTVGTITSPSKLLRDRFRIYFPSYETVSSSRGGRMAAGTICVQSKWWRSPTFPSELVRDCIAAPPRHGILMHSKMIFARPAEGAEGDSEDGRQSNQTKEKPKGWIYVGSANLSESAWGRLTKDRKTGKPKLTCRNWECGVVLVMPKSSSSSSGGNDDINSIFASTVPVPMVLPGPVYGKDRKPWFYTEG